MTVLNKKLSPGSEWSLTGAPREAEGPDLVPTSDNIVSSGGKVNDNSGDTQTETEDESGFPEGTVLAKLP